MKQWRTSLWMSPSWEEGSQSLEHPTPRPPTSLAWDKLRDCSRGAAHPRGSGRIRAPPRLTGPMALQVLPTDSSPCLYGKALRWQLQVVLVQIILHHHQNWMFATLQWITLIHRHWIVANESLPLNHCPSIVGIEMSPLNHCKHHIFPCIDILTFLLWHQLGLY